MYQKQEMTFREPESPVITTSLSLGISRLIFFKLCSFAPLITILSFILTPKHICTFIINTYNNYYTIFICFKQVFVESFLIYIKKKFGDLTKLGLQKEVFKAVHGILSF